MTGIPCYQIVSSDGNARAAPVRSFRHFKNDMLPPEVRKKFNLHWRPIFQLMEACPGLDVDRDSTESFNLAMGHLKTRASYIFEKPNANPNNWELSTWCKHVQRSAILKHGTESDKDALPPETRHNRPRSTGQYKRKRRPTSIRRTAQRGRRNTTTVTNNQAAEDNDGGSFLDDMIGNFDDADEIRRRVQNELEEFNQRKEAEQQRTRMVGVADDGTTVFVAPGATRGLGASSADGGRIYGERLRSVVDGQRETGLCAVVGCQHPEMQYVHKCDTCRRWVHIICMMTKDLMVSFEGGDEDHHYCSLSCKP